MNKLILAAEQGIVTLEREGDGWVQSTHGLTDQHVTSVIAREGVIFNIARYTCLADNLASFIVSKGPTDVASQCTEVGQGIRGIGRADIVDQCQYYQN